MRQARRTKEETTPGESIQQRRAHAHVMRVREFALLRRDIKKHTQERRQGRDPVPNAKRGFRDLFRRGFSSFFSSFWHWLGHHWQVSRRHQHLLGVVPGHGREWTGPAPISVHYEGREVLGDRARTRGSGHWSPTVACSLSLGIFAGEKRTGEGIIDRAWRDLMLSLTLYI